MASSEVQDKYHSCCIENGIHPDQVDIGDKIMNTHTYSNSI